MIARGVVVLAAALLSAAAPADQSPGTPTAAPPASPLARERRVTTRYDAYFQKFTKHYFGPTFDWRLFKAQAMAESNLKPTARSSAGARGLMQLMPSTYAQIASIKPHYKEIDDPQSNIGAGIIHDRDLYNIWKDLVISEDRTRFMFGSYNAGEMTIVRARTAAKRSKLDPAVWGSVVEVAPTVPRWRYKETLGYVFTIEQNYLFLTPQPPAVTGGH